MTIQITSLCLLYVMYKWRSSQAATRSRDEFATIKEEKYLEEDSANFTIAMCTQFHVRLQITRFYFPYMETNR